MNCDKCNELINLDEIVDIEGKNYCLECVYEDYFFCSVCQDFRKLEEQVNEEIELCNKHKILEALELLTDIELAYLVRIITIPEYDLKKIIDGIKQNKF